MKPIAAITSTPLGPIKGEGLGPFGNLTVGADSGLTWITNTVSSIVGFLTIAAAIWFLFNVLMGGYQWISSGGDPKQLSSARDRITHAFIGLVVVVGAWSLLAVVGQFFGFDTLVGSGVMKSLKIGQ